MVEKQKAEAIAAKRHKDKEGVSLFSKKRNTIIVTLQIIQIQTKPKTNILF